MKATFFSADFVTDSNDNPKLLEINTDTGYASTLNLDGIFDWTDLNTLLNDNSISELHIVYKPSIQSNIFEHLSASVVALNPSINITKTLVNGDSIFPTSPEDSSNIFILRMAYDETAILDSEYAKNNLNLLKMFADAGDTTSIINFYHSSSVYGNYDTLERTTNISNVPDLVAKPITFNDKPLEFYKLGKSTETIEERYTEFTNIVSSSVLIEQYTHNNGYQTTNKMSSIRTYNVVYGSNLDVINVASYELNALFELPSSITIDDTQINNKIDIKHYYEFATNTINNTKHGLLADELIWDIDGNQIPISTMQTGSLYPSFYVAGQPNTDDEDVLSDWYLTGDTLPSGSETTSSVCVYLFPFDTYANDVVKLTFEDGDVIEMGGANRLLIYDTEKNQIAYKKGFDLDTDDYVWDSEGNKVKITDIQFEILENPTTLYSPNMEDTDTFLIGQNKVLRLISHNVIFGVCFDENCLVEMFDGSQKRIADIQKGDVVKSYNKGEYVKGIVTDTLPHLVDGIVNMVKKGGLIADSKHPLFIDGKWKYAENLQDAEHYQSYYKTLYNLEIDGDKVYESEHNYIIDGHICSGLGDNPLLNIEFARQEKHLLPYLNK
jgi:hypothetical protein